MTNLSEVLEVPATSGTHWGISMTADDIYDIAGSYVCGYSGDGGPATSADLFFPTGVVFDSAGDLYIADAETTASRRSPPTQAASGGSP